MKSAQTFGPLLRPKFGGPKKRQIAARFRTTSRLDREYLRNASKYRQSENGIANYGHSRTGKLNSVYFGPQTAKNITGVLTHPPAPVQRTGVNKSVAFARRQHVYPTSGHYAGKWFCSLSFTLGVVNSKVVGYKGREVKTYFLLTLFKTQCTLRIILFMWLYFVVKC